MKIDSNEYGSYFEGYIKLSNNVPLEDQLRFNLQEMMHLFVGLTENNAMYRYDESKWTIKQVLGHMIDVERIFSYRALCIARGETKSLPGFDHDLYMQNAIFNKQTIGQLQDQYEVTRQATRTLFSSFSDQEMMRRGIISDSSFTVRATGYIIVGHELHHLNILKEKYLPGII